jgi:hypothetical protein
MHNYIRNKETAIGFCENIGKTSKTVFPFGSFLLLKLGML